jgi:lipopolysaccharide export LptBFGC system permease protein LptF
VILFAAFALIALSVPICGGRLRRLGALRLAAVWTVVVALAVQVLIISVLPRSLPGGAPR